MDTNTLADTLSDIQFLNGRAELQLCNRTPSGWQVTVVAAAAMFLYREGGSDTDGPRPLKLESGDCASFYSKDPKKCVWRIAVAATVTAPGEEPTPISGNCDAPEGKCILRSKLVIGEERHFDQSAERPLRLSDMLSIRIET